MGRCRRPRVLGEREPSVGWRADLAPLHARSRAAFPDLPLGEAAFVDHLSRVASADGARRVPVDELAIFTPVPAARTTRGHRTDRIAAGLVGVAYDSPGAYDGAAHAALVRCAGPRAGDGCDIFTPAAEVGANGW